MKKLIAMMALMMCFVGIGFAQEKFATYDNTYINKTYDISIDVENDDKFTLYINAMSVDGIHETGGFMINEKEYQKFIDALQSASLKYQEWDSIARLNNVVELNKKMTDIKCKAGGYFLYYDEWKFQFFLIPTFSFLILESNNEIKRLLIVGSGQMTASSNQYMDVDGVMLVFSSIVEIQDFINLISISKINEFKNQPKKEDLFK
jgi:hypothetical protein